MLLLLFSVNDIYINADFLRKQQRVPSGIDKVQRKEADYSVRCSSTKNCYCGVQNYIAKTFMYLPIWNTYWNGKFKEEKKENMLISGILKKVSFFFFSILIVSAQICYLVLLVFYVDISTRRFWDNNCILRP